MAFFLTAGAFASAINTVQVQKKLKKCKTDNLWILVEGMPEMQRLPLVQQRSQGENERNDSGRSLVGTYALGKS
jgi:hypothetical protein